MTSQGMTLRNLALVGQTSKITMPAQHKGVFEEGCALSFGRWTALQLGVANEWGGPDSREKAQQLLEDVINWFYSSKDNNEQTELEEMLDEAIQVDFHIQAEDDSPYQVARSLVNMHNQVAAGDYSYVEALRRMQPAGIGASQQEERPALEGAEDDSSSDDDGSQGSGLHRGEEPMDAEGGEDMDTDEGPAAAPRHGPIIDEDGFQVVTRKGKGGRR